MQFAVRRLCCSVVVRTLHQMLGGSGMASVCSSLRSMHERAQMKNEFNGRQFLFLASFRNWTDDIYWHQYRTNRHYNSNQCDCIVASSNPFEDEHLDT